MLAEIALGLLGIYGALVLAFFHFQRRLLYRPQGSMGEPHSYDLAGFETMRLSSEDGIPLTVWSAAARPGMPTVLYFHGNKGHLGLRSDTFAALARHGYGVLALCYRGFGTSSGQPSEQGLYQDARLLIAYAQEILHVEDNRLILFGESLGSGIAVQMATEITPAMVLLESPYTSILRRGQALYPYVPVKYLLRDRFDSIGKIAAIRAPLLIFHGEKDRVVPSSDGRALLDAAPEPKQGLFFADRGHIDFTGEELAGGLDTYARNLGLIA